MNWLWLVGISAGHAWTGIFLRRGFGHCWAARPLWDDLWLWIEWTPGRLVIGPVSQAVIDQAVANATCVWEVETVPGQRVHHRPWPVLGWWHCVRMVVDALGVRMPWWPTPWGLARALRHMPGAREAKGHAESTQGLRAVRR